MKDIEKFSAFMEGYVAFLEEMAQGEGEKYAALLSYEAKRVDRVVSRQQAMNMRLSQLEEQREREQEEAGLGGLSFQEILARLDKTEQGRLPELFPRFSSMMVSGKGAGPWISLLGRYGRQWKNIG